MKTIIRLLPCLLLPLLPVGAEEVKILKVGANPESVRRGFDGKLFVTIINGSEPGDGGINVIRGDAVTEFCRGMNDPKGMDFVGGYLVVADEKTVWKVDRNGAATKIVEASDFPHPVEYLNDVAASGDGKSVYVTEMSNPKWMFDPGGERKLWPLDSENARKAPMTGRVYRVTLDGKVSVAVPAGDKSMPGPNGVTVSSAGEKETLLMGDFFTGNIVSYDGENFSTLIEGLRGTDSVAVDDGLIYVSSWSQGKVWKFDRKAKVLTLLSDQFTTAADFLLEREKKQLIVPDMAEGTVTFLPLD